MNDTKVLLEGPFLTIDREGFVHVMTIRGGRCGCTHAAYRERYFDDIDIYDRSRNWFKIRAAALVESSIWKKVAFLLFGGRMAVDLDIEFQRRVSQEEIVEAVTDSLRKDEDFWSEGRDVDELIGEINATRDVEAIMSALGYD